MVKLKILSLDGGGSWVLLQSMALREIYKDTSIGTKCGDILNHFDVIVANSGGAMMLAAMIENYDKDIDEVTKLFLNESIRRSMFNKITWRENNLIEYIASTMKFGSKYKADKKITGIENVLKETGKVKLHELHNIHKLPGNIVICSFDYDSSSAVFFRINQEKDRKKCEVTLAQAVHAACNAQVYYLNDPAKYKIHGTMHHNPVLIGITEALGKLDDGVRNYKNLHVLSIGTGNNLLPLKGFTITDESENDALMKLVKNHRLSGSIRNMDMAIISEPLDNTNYIAHMFLGGNHKNNSEPGIIRLNVLLKPVLSFDDKVWWFPAGLLPDEEQTFCDLLELDMGAINQKDMESIQKLGQWWINDKVTNQPIRSDGWTLQSRIGYDKFSAGKNEWLKRTGLVNTPNGKRRKN